MRLRRAIIAIATPVAILATVTSCLSVENPKPPQSLPDHVITVEYDATGWANSFKPGEVITDGWTVFDVKMGPVRIVSLTTTHRGSSADVLGFRIRRVGVDPDVTPFDSNEGFPPINPQFAANALDAVEATLDGPQVGEDAALYQLQVGYRVPSSGKYTRESILMTYEYHGIIGTITIPSKVDLCVPKGVECEHQGK